MKRLLQNVTETICVGPNQPQTIHIVEDQKKREVFSFLGNDNRWYIRFCPTHLGTLHLTYDSLEKVFSVVPNLGTNPFYRHGPLICPIRSTYLTHTDGTTLFLLTDTWWFAMTKRTTDEQLAFLIADRKKKGFTAVQFVIAYPPETAVDSPDAANLGGFPLIDGVCNPAYFEVVDRRIQMIVQAGLVPIIYGSWGHHIDSIGKQSMLLLWKEILARYSEYPCILSVCGEVDVNLSNPKTIAHPLRQSLLKKRLALSMPTLYEKASVTLNALRRIKHHLLEGKQLQLRLVQWNEIAEWIFLHNRNKRPMTIHVSRRERASTLLHNPRWLMIDSIQSGHNQSGYVFMRQALEEAAQDHKRIINLEPWYEGILNNFDAYHQRKALWVSMLCGAVGHGYGAHGVWQMATQQDNFMSHWGKSDWKQAVNAPGSCALGKTVKFFIKHGGLDGQRLDLSWEHHLSLLHQPFGLQTKKHIMIYVPQLEYAAQLELQLPCAVQMVYWYNPDTLTLIKKEEIYGDSIALQMGEYQEQDLLMLATYQ